MISLLFALALLYIFLKPIIERYLPLWEPTRFTRLQSYDIRGEPCIIRPQSFPWMQSSIAGPRVAQLRQQGLPYCN